ncbi:hypothetical protein HanPI659440_Chr01g0017941 [Helianthus annuus]|nr:hypothetical protein HanPI659440_Chr01g0017941 [Helianthus annuus]
MIDNYFSLIKYIWITKSLTHRSCSSLTCVSDWMRIGAFSFDSPDAFLMKNLICPPTEDTVQKMLDSYGSCILHNIKTGIWIADLQLVRCPVCDLNTCDGEKILMKTKRRPYCPIFL